MPDHFIEKQFDIFKPDVDIELALSALAIAERVGDFGETYWTAAGGDEIDQDFEADTGKPVDDFFKKAPVDNEEAAHGVREIALCDGAAEPFPKTAEHHAFLSERAHTAAFDVAAADNEIQTFAPNALV